MRHRTTSAVAGVAALLAVPLVQLPADAAGVTCRGRQATMVGTAGPDTLRGTRRGDVFVGRGGADVIRGRGGQDVICGGGDDDKIRGGTAADDVSGSKGDDTLLGGKGPDLVAGGGAADILTGGAGNDFLDGGGGMDSLVGAGGADSMAGGTGNDLLDGVDAAPNDDLSGDAGLDSCEADHGDAVSSCTDPGGKTIGVRGQWHFDETSGSVAYDSSEYGNNGAVIDATLGVPGYVGTAYEFDGTGSRVEVPASSSLNPGTSNFDVTAWVNFTDAPGSGETYDIYRKGVAATPGGEFKLEIISGGRAKCTAKDSDRLRGVIAGPSVSLADGAWHLVGCRRTDSSWSVIVDDTVTSTTVPFGSISNDRPVSIGSKYGEEDFVPGRIDEVQFTVG